MKAVDFKVFRAAADLPQGRVARCGCERRHADAQGNRRLHDVVAIYGAKGLAYIKVKRRGQGQREGLQSPIVKFLPPEVLTGSWRAPARKRRPDLLSAPARRRSSNDAPRRASRAVGHDRGFATPAGTRSGRRFSDVRIRRHPKAWRAPSSLHSAAGRAQTSSRARRGEAIAKAYDVVLTAGNRRRIRADSTGTRAARRCSLALGITQEDQPRKFGSCSTRCSTARRRTGGIAFGFDRMVAMMAGVEQIRDGYRLSENATAARTCSSRRRVLRPTAAARAAYPLARSEGAKTP